ncbi:hypothetical protein DL769_009603 [Monosporascus sp. CRB-8-3]|nr:hypothetical protein DL769_009603 [Monosporascus sp. CRB-8-3]
MVDPPPASAKNVPDSWTPSTLAFLFILAVSLSVLLLREYRSWKKLAHIPGPSAAHFSIIWLLRHAWSGNLFPCMTETGDEYGPLARIGPNLLLCSDSDELKKMSGVRSEYTKGPAYEAGRVSDGEPHVASERDPARHKALRIKMGPAYSIDVQPAIDRQVSKLLDLIDRKYASDPAATAHQRETSATFMDFGQKMHFYALDCLGDFVFSEPFGFLERDEDVRRMTQVNDLSLRMVTVAGLMPWLAGLRSKWPFKYLLPREGDKVGFGIMFGSVSPLIPHSGTQFSEAGVMIMTSYVEQRLNFLSRPAAALPKT